MLTDSRLFSLHTTGYTNLASLSLRTVDLAPRAYSATVCSRILVFVGRMDLYRSGSPEVGACTTGSGLECAKYRLPRSFVFPFGNILWCVIINGSVNCRLIGLLIHAATENINGALPNQDLLNTVAHIAQWTAGVPVRLHSLSAEYVILYPHPFDNTLFDTDSAFSLEPVVCPEWLPAFGCDVLQRREVAEYIRGAKHLVQHAKYAALGRMSGAHGIFAR